MSATEESPSREIKHDSRIVANQECAEHAVIVYRGSGTLLAAISALNVKKDAPGDAQYLASPPDTSMLSATRWSTGDVDRYISGLPPHRGGVRRYAVCDRRR